MAQQQATYTEGVTTKANIRAAINANATDAESRLTLLSRSSTERVSIANNATDANNDIDFSAGVEILTNGTSYIPVAMPAMTKRLDASWVAGNNQGGLSTGTKANSTWYYIYGVYNTTTGVADYIFDPSPTSPTLSSGFTYSKRLLGGAMLTDGSGNILQWKWFGHQVEYDALILDSVTSLTTTPSAFTLSVPAFPVRAKVYSTIDCSGTVSAGVFFRPPSMDVVGEEIIQIYGGGLNRVLKRVRAENRQIEHWIGSVTNVIGSALYTLGFEDIY
jgi:plasmid stability protein